MKTILIVVGIIIVVLGAAFGRLMSKMPKKGPALVSLEGGIQGVLCRFSYAWIVPSATGVILIDAGLDENAPDIIAALRRAGLGPESVRGILITHGHADHFGGAAAFPGAPVFAHAGDIPLIRGEHKRTGIIGSIFSAISARKKPPSHLEPLPAQDSITIDGVTFAVMELPGHSPGSVAYVLGNIVFSGDAVMGRGASLMLPNDFTCTDPALARRSIAKLAGIGFTTIADGHTGAVYDGRRKLEGFLTTLHLP